MSRRAARNTYFPPAQGMSPSLRRARQPFFWPNLITGTLILGFAGTVYAYSIRAVRQEDFSGMDVKVLEEEERTKRTQAQSAVAQGIVDVEASILGAGPMGSRKEEGTALAAQQAVDYNHSSIYPLSWLHRTFPGRSSGRSVIIPDAPSIDKPSRILDSPRIA